MKIAYFIKKTALANDARIEAVLRALESGGAQVCRLSAADRLDPASDMLISFGGDGTFLSAAVVAHDCGVPVLGINLGRMGFLAGAGIEGLAGHILSGDYCIEERQMICASGHYALNEVSLCRVGAYTVGVDVEVDGNALPTYWADGLLVATTSGSTAYNLSVGGPICMPGSKVFVISPIAPHNLGVRPLVIPDSSMVRLTVKSRHGGAVFSCDNRVMEVPDGFSVDLRLADKPLKCVTIGDSNFIDALRNRFFWGQDVRNTTEQ